MYALTASTMSRARGEEERMRASDRAYDALREAILSGELAPGAPLGEVEQAQRLGVSRTPVREALSRLIADGLATARSPRVLVVTELSEARIRDVYELRQALETQAAAIAARRGNPAEFSALRERLAAAPALLEGGGDAGIEAYFELVDALDGAIDRSLGNAVFHDALASARLHSARIRRLSRHDPARLAAAAEEHLLVAEAIAEGDAELAAHATHVHLRRSLCSALERAAGSLRNHTAGQPHG